VCEGRERGFVCESRESGGDADGESESESESDVQIKGPARVGKLHL
jgi:hypothetical protein